MKVSCPNQFLDSEITMHAVIKTGGKQYKVSAGDRLNVESIGQEVGEKVAFDKVLLLSYGESVSVGAPYVAGATVNAKVLEHGRGSKIRIIKFKRRKHYKLQMGHRQNYTRIEVTEIVKE